MALELSNLRHMPGLAHRPNFPRDLHIVLIEPDYKARQEAEAQLRENHYTVTPCSCSAEAAALLADATSSCDILLADCSTVRCLDQKSAKHNAIVQAAKTIPLVLMSDSGSPSEVMLGIKLGAVDFLDKPLSPLKLKNIWQHSVRRLLSASPGLPAQLKKAAAASGTASPEDSGLQCGGSGSASHGSGGESGSNASTSDQAAIKVEYDADMETSSLQGALACMAPFPAATAAAAGRSDDAAWNAPAAAAAAAVGSGPAGCGATVFGGDPMQPQPCAAAAAAAGGAACGRSRPQPHKYKAGRACLPGGADCHECGGGGGACSSGGAPKPCIGYPAGQLPALPPGVEWGLPTNPLQISPKAPVGGMMGPMGWPASPFMGSMGPLGPMGPMFPSMFPMGSPTPSVASMPAMPPAGGCGSLHLSASCLTLSSAATNASAAACGAGAGGGGGAHAPLPIRRAESAPLPTPSCVSHASAATGNMPPPPMGPPPLRDPSVGGAADAQELLQCWEAGKSSLVPPPIGLQLKKSPSFLDFIKQMLDGAVC